MLLLQMGVIYADKATSDAAVNDNDPTLISNTDNSWNAICMLVQILTFPYIQIWRQLKQLVRVYRYYCLLKT